MATSLSIVISDTCGCVIFQRNVLPAVSGRPLQNFQETIGCVAHKALRGSYRVTATECVLNFRPAHLPGPITHKISPGNNSPDTGFELVQKKNGGWKFIANREMVIFAGS